MFFIAFRLERFGLDRRIIDIIEDRKIESLRWVQVLALRAGVLDGENIFVSAPSASGKTFIGELAALQNIVKNKKKSVFLVPLRALAAEKYYEFAKIYSKLGIKVEIRTGDYEINKETLEKVDLLVSTYERFDSLLRNGLWWLTEVGMIVIDEVHMINDIDRGPRLESLLARLRKYLPEAQLIALSATVANPEEVAEWLGCKLIEYNERPVKLIYKIIVTADKIQSIKELVMMTLKSNGQVLIFTKTRKEAQKLASDLVKIILDEKLLGATERVELDKIFRKQDLANIAKLDRSLINTMKYGVAYHHAGLAAETRRLVEENFRNRLIKVIACTTTLAAGVNLPAKTVIVKDCQVITTDPNILACDDKLYWKNQLDNNLLHQILGRAGRPGFDKVGLGVILAPTKVDANRLVQYYFNMNNGEATPKYAIIKSQLNQREVLYEQILVRLKEFGKMTQDEILEEFKKTYWWHQTHNEDPNKKIDQLIEIGAVSIEKTIESLTTKEIREKANNIPDEKVKIVRANNGIIQALVKDVITQTTTITRDYPGCTCREFKYRIENNQITLCRHLIKLIQVGMKTYPRLTNDLACLSLQREFILDSLIKMGMVAATGETYYATELGELTASLFIKPSSAKIVERRLGYVSTVSDLVELIEKLYIIEMNRNSDSMFLNIMIELIHRKNGEKLPFKILEVSERYFKGRGDIEEFIDFTRWMAHAITQLAQLFQFEKVAEHSKFIEDSLIEAD